MEITINGIICKQPRFTRTALGTEVCYFIIALKDASEFAYIQCKITGSDAFTVYNKKVGEMVKIKGYFKDIMHQEESVHVFIVERILNK